MYKRQGLVPVVSTDVVVEKILPFVNHLSTDNVPNIRFNVAKFYAVIVEALTKNTNKNHIELINNTIIPTLEKLCQDPDVDVRFFSAQSLEKCKSFLS